MKESPGEHWQRLTSRHGRPHDTRTAWDHDDWEDDTSDRTTLKWFAVALLLAVAAAWWYRALA